MLAIILGALVLLVAQVLSGVLLPQYLTGGPPATILTFVLSGLVVAQFSKQRSYLNAIAVAGIYSMVLTAFATFFMSHGELKTESLISAFAKVAGPFSLFFLLCAAAACIGVRLRFLLTEGGDTPNA